MTRGSGPARDLEGHELRIGVDTDKAPALLWVHRLRNLEQSIDEIIKGGADQDMEKGNGSRMASRTDFGS